MCDLLVSSSSLYKYTDVHGRSGRRVIFFKTGFPPYDLKLGRDFALSLCVEAKKCAKSVTHALSKCAVDTLKLPLFSLSLSLGVVVVTS